MDEDKFKKLLDEAMAPLREDIKEVKQDVNGVKQDIKGIKETQEDHTRRLEALAGDSERLIEEVKALKDKSGMFHFRNKREIDEIKDHLNLPIIPDRPEI